VHDLCRAAFHDDVPRLTTLLKKLPASDICELDCHGNNVREGLLELAADGSIAAAAP
jgi:hypothetical protein